MKTPTFVVVVSLAAAIILAASLVIATGTRGGNVLPERTAAPASRISSAGQ
ncbi:MAG: hypothetical protein K2X60_13160 [Xanthobacteraceae bacterium]|nr:hypothetical protein [Xanthobacteraceae bacterium]